MGVEGKKEEMREYARKWILKGKALHSQNADSQLNRENRVK
jgi:hypothetical protein